MSDISRQQAIDEISKYASIWMEYDADMTQEEVAEAALNAAKRTLVHILEELPSTQPEIIRCKDCKHWDKTWTNDWAENYHYCPMIDGVRKVDFYCADAERRTNG